ncbi:hypothetical protein T06_706, partial [Trichinella sp. T6]
LYCNGPLPRVGSSASSTRLLARQSLFGDGPVLTGVFPFFSASRFLDGIATIKQQTMSIHFIRLSETSTDDDITTNTHAHFLATCQPLILEKRGPTTINNEHTHTFWPLAHCSCKQRLPYSASDLHFSSSSFSAGEISLARSMSAAVPTLNLNCDYFNFE